MGKAAKLEPGFETGIGADEARHAGPVIVDKRITGKGDLDLWFGGNGRRYGREIPKREAGNDG